MDRELPLTTLAMRRAAVAVRSAVWLMDDRDRAAGVVNGGLTTGAAVAAVLRREIQP